MKATDRTYGVVALVGIVIATLAGVLLLGLLSGIAIVIAYLNLAYARRAAVQARRRLAWAGVAVAWLGAGVVYWMWQWFLWDSHHHPGAGGAIPPPTWQELAWMPLISAGLGVGLLVVFVGLHALRRWDLRRMEKRYQASSS